MTPVVKNIHDLVRIQTNVESASLVFNQVWDNIVSPVYDQSINVRGLIESKMR